MITWARLDHTIGKFIPPVDATSSFKTLCTNHFPGDLGPISFLRTIRFMTNHVHQRGLGLFISARISVVILHLHRSPVDLSYIATGYMRDTCDLSACAPIGDSGLTILLYDNSPITRLNVINDNGCLIFLRVPDRCGGQTGGRRDTEEGGHEVGEGEDGFMSCLL